MPEWSAADREAYLALALVPGIGAARMSALLDRLETPARVLGAGSEALDAVQGISTAAATAIAGADLRQARAAMARLAELGGQLLLPGDAAFPAALRDIPDPPLHLFALGDVALLSRPAVAIVGSRDHSLYGAEVCRAVARTAAEAGLAVVSGMARGLDAVAHAGALEGKGATIGVLGNGLGVVYPAANRELYERVARDGLLLTEFPPGERPTAGSFPRRNRLISGLSRVVVVVEAALTSGALQTVACALEQGREVLAVPGQITSPVSAGANRLLRDGAGPLLELDDLLAHYPEGVRRDAAPAPRLRGSPSGGAGLTREIVNALWSGPRRVEELVGACGAPVDAALDALSALELAGRVIQEAGGVYRLAAPALFL
jgi:DNA processing protein